MDTRRDAGEFYPGGKVISTRPLASGGDVKHSEFEDLDVKTNTIPDLREAVRELGRRLGATVVAALAVCVAIGATVEKAKLNDLDFDTDPQVVTNVTFEGLAASSNVYTKVETEAKIVELAPAPGDYANVSNRAMNAVQTEADPVWNAEKSGYAKKADLAGKQDALSQEQLDAIDDVDNKLDKSKIVDPLTAAEAPQSYPGYAASADRTGIYLGQKLDRLGEGQELKWEYGHLRLRTSSGTIVFPSRLHVYNLEFVATWVRVLARLAPQFSSSATYEVGQLVSYDLYSGNDDATLYRCTTKHTGSWNALHFTEATIEDILAVLRGECAAMAAKKRDWTDVSAGTRILKWTQQGDTQYPEYVYSDAAGAWVNSHGDRIVGPRLVEAYRQGGDTFYRDKETGGAPVYSWYGSDGSLLGSASAEQLDCTISIGWSPWNVRFTVGNDKVAADRFAFESEVEGVRAAVEQKRDKADNFTIYGDAAIKTWEVSGGSGDNEAVYSRGTYVYDDATGTWVRDEFRAIRRKAGTDDTFQLVADPGAAGEGVMAEFVGFGSHAVDIDYAGLQSSGVVVASAATADTLARRSDVENVGAAVDYLAQTVIPQKVDKTALAGETLPEYPTQNELAEAVKKIFVALGGTIQQ